jgi:hypothetical protein
MAGQITNLFVLMAVGVILADMIQPAHVQGTKDLFNGVAKLWSIGVNGMLGKTS